MVVGSITSQRMSTVVSSKNGSMTAVVGSGMRIMSDSLMPFHPAMEEPSNILPSWKKFSIPARLVDENFFHDGKMFDGSSIAGWKGINESDMILMPDPTTAVIDPLDRKSVV